MVERMKAGDKSRSALEISVDMDKPCKRCGEKGATQNGYCLRCCAQLIAKGRVGRMDKAQKCDEMTRLVLKIESVKAEKADANKEFNEEINGLEEKLLEVARERTDQMEIPFPKKQCGKEKEEKRAAVGD